MIRSVGGSFICNSDELEVMKLDIIEAARAGASGVVFGILDSNNQISSSNLELLELSESLGLEATFHRAYDQVANRNFKVVGCPGAKILADYPSKHHSGAHHSNMCPMYLHEKNLPWVLQRAPWPKELRELMACDPEGSRTLQGCVGSWSSSAPRVRT